MSVHNQLPFDFPQMDRRLGVLTVVVVRQGFNQAFNLSRSIEEIIE
ncbi:Uncharacterised protein [Vibrio cholerae]|nr:Uncharacterised protein [Vibrio cholerae]